MTVQLLAENILTDAHFLSAGSQASGFWGQPAPASANTGKFRLLSQGSASDFSYSGTTSADGNVGKTTLIDIALDRAYGTDFFVGGTVFLPGAAETRTISAFDSTNGTVTVSAAFSSQVLHPVAYTITIPFSDRDFRMALTAGGDAGVAKFHWSHNGGTTWLSRDNPNQHNWKDGATIFNNITNNRCPITQAADGTLVAFYNSAADTKVYCKRSTDGGITWSAAVLVSANNRIPRVALTLSNGRILVFMDKHQTYSDDNGENWAAEMALNIASTAGNIYACVELASGVLIAVHRDTSNNICHVLSPDGGFTWTTNISIRTGCGSSATPAIVQAQNGSLICAYSILSTDYEIRCKISPDGGTTWGAEITIYNAPESLYVPVLLKDINGMIFMACYDDLATPKIVYSVSSDNGATWSAADDLYATGSCKYPTLVLVDGHRILCGYATGTNAAFCHRGFWHYGGTSGYCAIEAIPQRLICGAELIWHGYAGVTADAWSFAREYDFAMENLIADSPSRPWRTVADSADYAVVMDLGANARFYADGAAFFGCNVRTLSIQMNDTDSWGSPSLNQSVSFDLATGAIDAASGNFIQDTSLLAGYADHELRGQYLRMTSGTSSGVTWKILDNFSSWIVLDTTAAISVSVNDTFAIFGTKAAVAFTANVKRYVRILISTQQTAEDFYQIGSAVAGRMVTLDRGIQVGFGRTRQANVDMLRTPAGGLIPVQGANPKNVFELTFPQADLGRTQLLAMMDYLRGKNLVLVPDSADLLNVYLVKSTADAKQTHKFLDRYDVVLTLEEVL